MDMDVATIRLQDAGIRKAAILVASLAPSAADVLLNQLGPDRADLVRQAVVYLDEIGLEERQRIIDEFRRIGPMVPGQSPSGIELDRLPVKKTMAASIKPRPAIAPKSVDVEAGVISDAPPFEFLRGAKDEKLANLLGGERPATVALVLSHLPPERAGEVLACLVPATQAEVVRRLVELENADPETLREVERALESRWTRQFADERQREVGPETVAKILASCDGRVRGRILANLAMHDQSLAERFGDRPIAFDDIAQFDDAMLLTIYRAAEPEVALAAFFGAPPALVERLLNRMPQEEAKRLRRKFNHPGPIRLSDIEEARRQIAALAQRISRDTPRKTAA